MGLQEIFSGMFQSKGVAIGKNRPYFLRAVELVKSLKGLSNTGSKGQNELPMLYKELETVLKKVEEASGDKAEMGQDKVLDEIFEEATRQVYLFLLKQHSPERAKEFLNAMNKARERDFVAVDMMNIMQGRVAGLLKKYKGMKKTTIDLLHWLQPQQPSIHTYDWSKKSLWAKYEVEDGITVEEFINRLLTVMIQQKTSRFRDDLLMRNPKIYHERIIDKPDFYNIMRKGETRRPEKMEALLKDIKGLTFDLAFDFANHKGTTLQDLLHHIFNTDSTDVSEWLHGCKNAQWIKCPADHLFNPMTADEVDGWCAYEKSRYKGVEVPTAYKKHEGHVIHRDSEGNIKHELVFEHHLRKLPSEAKYEPRKKISQTSLSTASTHTDPTPPPLATRQVTTSKLQTSEPASNTPAAVLSPQLRHSSIYPAGNSSSKTLVATTTPTLQRDSLNVKGAHAEASSHRSVPPPNGPIPSNHQLKPSSAPSAHLTPHPRNVPPSSQPSSSSVASSSNTVVPLDTPTSSTPATREKNEKLTEGTKLRMGITSHMAPSKPVTTTNSKGISGMFSRMFGFGK